MNYKDIKIDEISYSVELKERVSKKHKENEEYVLELLEENEIDENIGIENPIDDLVYLYPEFLYADEISDEGIKKFAEVYNQLKEIFEEIKISLHLDGFLTGENGETFNEVDVTLDEFLALT